MLSKNNPLTLEAIFAKPTFRVATVPGFDWLLGVRYNGGLTNVDATGHTARNSNFQLYVGYLFGSHITQRPGQHSFLRKS